MAIGRMITAVVSGSFHRHMTPIERAVRELGERGVQVLSPADPRIVANIGEFLFVASDRVRSIKLVQDRHLEAIRSADFLWLVCPDGYVGQSASMELGFAAAAGVPVMTADCPTDLTLRHYATRVSDIGDAVTAAFARSEANPKSAFLIDPKASIDTAHHILEQLNSTFSRPASSIREADADAIQRSRRRLVNLISPIDLQ
jgi:hypothetical protein